MVVKGDLPIGIYRHSVDAWTQPELYHMHQQAGAPPDDFSVTGQNWRFPTYNWERMAEDGYQWWKQRMGHLARYFDALRIDHILGFFRIWEIPGHSVEGLLGHFSPALPLHRHEIEQRLGWFDYGRLCEPYIRWHVLQAVFHAQAQAVFDEFMEDAGYGAIRLKEHVRTQRQMEAVINEKISQDPANAEHYNWLRAGLFGLVNEVLFVPDDQQADHYHPRITLYLSRSYRELDEYARPRLLALYNDFFYHRHEEFWRRAGPDQAAGRALGHRHAHLRRRPGHGARLGARRDEGPGHPGPQHPAHARQPRNRVRPPRPRPLPERGQPRLARHEHPARLVGRRPRADPALLRNHPGPLARAGPAVLRALGGPRNHRAAPALARHVGHLPAPGPGGPRCADLRRPDPLAEQINVPANPTHFWKYRFHIPLEDLREEAGFNAEIQQLVNQSGRNQVY